MTREVGKLKITIIEAAIKAGRAGMHSDGGGLYLRIDPRHGATSWVYRYRDSVTSRLRDKGLGRYPDISLKDARQLAGNLRTMRQKGIDPISALSAEREASKASARPVTFGQCALECLNAKKAGWRNAKHGQQWISTLETYASRIMGKPVASITRADVLACIEKDWQTKTETMTRVRQRIETVIDYAKARDLYTGDNPAKWRGSLKELLAPPNKLKDVQHHPALAYRDIGSFMALLTGKGALSPDGALSYKALAITILTASRISEVVNARWQEIDLDGGRWVIPKDRMKSNREHIVPLSPEVIHIFRTLQPQAEGYVFRYGIDRRGNPKPITDAAPRKVCKELNPAITVHGFRSTFRDWAADMTAYPREVAEAALAHVLSDKTEAAYRRTTMLEKRAQLMTDWAKHCFTTLPKGAAVTPIRRA